MLLHAVTPLMSTNHQGIDDFIARMEVALCGFGFTGQNSIGKKSNETPVASAAVQTVGPRAMTDAG